MSELTLPQCCYNIAVPAGIIIDGLVPATAYQFKICFETDFGSSAPSDETGIVFTRPSSPPSNLQMQLRNESSITIAWDAPANIFAGLKINSYTARIFDESKKTMMQVIVKTREATLRNLKAYQQYFVEVVAHVNNTSSNPEQLKVFTAPPSPKDVTIKNISLNTVTIQWRKPGILNLTTGIEYIVRYTMMDTIGKHSIGGTEHTVTGISQPTAEIKALAEGTYYQFEVKVVTSKGSSDFSPVSTAKTIFKQTQLDKLKENIYVQLIKPGIYNLQKSINASREIAVTNLAVERTKLAAERTAAAVERAKLAADLNRLDKKMMQNKNDVINERYSTRKSISAVSKKVDDLWYESTHALTLCSGFQVGDGTGGNGETSEGYKANAAECIRTCIERKKTYPEINGVTVQNRLNNVYCWCERGMTGDNGDTSIKHCSLR